jgi:hypothetical protein
MELKTKHIVNVIILPILIGIITSYIYDMIKGHPITGIMGSLQVEFNFLIKFN